MRTKGDVSLDVEIHLPLSLELHQQYFRLRSEREFFKSKHKTFSVVPFLNSIIQSNTLQHTAYMYLSQLYKNSYNIKIAINIGHVGNRL